MSRLGRPILWCAGVVLCMSAIAAAAEQPKLEDFFFGTRLQQVSVSPDARFLSLILIQDGKSIVAVMDRSHGNALRGLAASPEKDQFQPRWCGWANESRLLCSYSGLGTDAGLYYEETRLMAVSADGSGLRQLNKDIGVGNAQFQDQIIDSGKKKIAVAANVLDVGDAAHVLGRLFDGHQRRLVGQLDKHLRLSLIHI